MYRAFIEHAVKHMYIFVCCAKAGDAVGTEYVSSEHMSHEMLLKLGKSQWPDSFQPDTDRVNLGEFKELKGRAKRIAHQFTFGEMARSLLEILDEHLGKMAKEALRSLILNYSTLSSYVHAGPTAVLNLEERSKKTIDMNSVLWAMVVHKHTIELLSFYPSEHQDELRTCTSKISDKIERVMAMFEEPTGTGLPPGECGGEG
jgi:hypothetical protein